jgi:hypothetical protein
LNGWKPTLARLPPKPPPPNTYPFVPTFLVRTFKSQPAFQPTPTQLPLPSKLHTSKLPTPTKPVSNRLARTLRVLAPAQPKLVHFIPTDTPPAPTVPSIHASRKRHRRQTLLDIPDELSKYIARDSRLFDRLGFAKLVAQRRARGDFATLDKITGHPAHR